MLSDFENKVEAAIMADPDGSNFVKDMFFYQLQLYEYTGETDEALKSLSFTLIEIMDNEKLKNGFLLALDSFDSKLEKTVIMRR